MRSVLFVPKRLPTTLASSTEEKTDDGGDGKTASGAPTAPDGGELGGIALGMEERDDYERELKVWEAAEAAEETKRK
jgi:hypothetical protein